LSAIVALIEGDVAPVDQLYVTNGLLVESTAVLPEQYAVGPLIKGVGFGWTVTNTWSLAVQPLAAVPVTV